MMFCQKHLQTILRNLTKNSRIPWSFGSSFGRPLLFFSPIQYNLLTQQTSQKFTQLYLTHVSIII